MHQRSGHAVYDELHDVGGVPELRKQVPRASSSRATIAFLAWYLLYVVMSNWATDFMSTKVVGNINVALVFGLLQFVSTFLIAWLYAATWNSNVDPLARGLEQRYNDELDDGGVGR